MRRKMRRPELCTQVVFWERFGTRVSAISCAANGSDETVSCGDFSTKAHHPNLALLVAFHLRVAGNDRFLKGAVVLKETAFAA